MCNLTKSKWTLIDEVNDSASAMSRHLLPSPSYGMNKNYEKFVTATSKIKTKGAAVDEGLSGEVPAGTASGSGTSTEAKPSDEGSKAMPEGAAAACTAAGEAPSGLSLEESLCRRTPAGALLLPGT